MSQDKKNSLQTIRSILQMSCLSGKLRKQGKSIGFVPTMGALHEGHLSLIRQARKENDCVVVSIFVNPLQFGPKEDFKKYPRDIKRDEELCAQEGVDIVFYPSSEDMYKRGFATYVEVEGLSEVLCGRYRHGHFRGVATVVSKLFNIVQPQRAYFGQKDAQQAIIIKRMVEDLNFPLKIVVLPTVRDKDGLAMSSRNAYLSPEERRVAPIIYQALKAGQRIFRRGVHDSFKIKAEAKKIIRKENIIRIQYLEIVDSKNLKPVKKVRSGDLFCLACYLGKTRLIDNIIF